MNRREFMKMATVGTAGLLIGLPSVAATIKKKSEFQKYLDSLNDTIIMSQNMVMDDYNGLYNSYAKRSTFIREKMLPYIKQGKSICVLFKCEPTISGIRMPHIGISHMSSCLISIDIHNKKWVVTKNRFTSDVIHGTLTQDDISMLKREYDLG